MAAGAALLPAVVPGRALANVHADAQRLATLAATPLYFEPAQGRQADAREFVARGQDCEVWLTPADAVLVLENRRAVRFHLVGANPGGRLSGLDELPGRANYFVGRNPAAWRTGVPLFSRVRVAAVYPGIDVAYYCREARLEYDFVLQPGARPGRIALRIAGADATSVDAAGNLSLKVGAATVTQHKPVIYQVVNGVRNPVAGGYRIAADGTVGFRLGRYDPNLPLVIDPVLSFSTYLGGSRVERGWGIALDNSGNVYVAGETLSPNLPVTPGAFSTTFHGGTAPFGDAFVAKYSPATNGAYALSYLTYLGGKGSDAAFGLAVDPNSGNAYVTGFTTSPDFPVFTTNQTAHAFQTRIAGVNNNGAGAYPSDAFVTGLDSSGSNLIFSTYLGGFGRESGLGIALDRSNFVYVTGLTESTNFPTTNALQGLYVRGKPVGTLTNYSGGVYHRVQDAFVSKLSPDGTTLVYSSYLGGSAQEQGAGIAVDSNGCAYVCGFTHSADFPVTNPLGDYLNQITNATSSADGFVAKLSADGRSLLYSTYLGGRWDDFATAIALDPSASAYVTGYSYSTNFPTLPTASVNPFPTFSGPTNGAPDVFVTKFNPDGTFNYSVRFGGRLPDYGLAIKADAAGDAFVAGLTASTNLFATNVFSSLPPLSGGLSTTNSSIPGRGRNDAFVAGLNPGGTNFLFAAYLGGSANDQANGLALDPAGNAYLVGTTASTNFPNVNPAQARPRGPGKTTSAFVAKIFLDPPPRLAVAPTARGLALSWPGFSPELTLETSTNPGASNAWTSVRPAVILANGLETVLVPATNGSAFFRLRGPP